MISINFYEIIWQIINFCVLLFFMKKLLYQPLVSFLEKREKSIESDIKHASDSKTQSDTLLGEQKEALKSALLEARDIREKAEEASKKEYESVIKELYMDMGPPVLYTYI